MVEQSRDMGGGFGLECWSSLGCRTRAETTTPVAEGSPGQEWLEGPEVVKGCIGNISIPTFTVYLHPRRRPRARRWWSASLPMTQCGDMRPSLIHTKFTKDFFASGK